MDINNERLWPLSSDHNDTHKMVSYCPKGKFKTEWGKTEFKKLEDYLILDPVTDKGRTYIEKYHGFADEWNVIIMWKS